MNIGSFTPYYATTSITVGASSANVQVFNTGQMPFPQSQVRIFNSGSAVTYIAFGNSSVTATTASIPIAPNSVEVMTNPGAGSLAYIAAIGTAGNTIYFTPGEGL
jgi:hypothetical protein